MQLNIYTKYSMSYITVIFQVNAGTLLDFFNQLSKTPGPGGFSDSIEKVVTVPIVLNIYKNPTNIKY